jgi:hypothetical protein
MNSCRLTLRRWAIRTDVVLGLAVAVMLTCVVLWELHSLLTGAAAGSSDVRSFASAIVAAWAAIVLACIGGAIKITATRQSLITLFTSEIRAIQYGLARMHMFAFWAQVHANAGMGAAGFADVPRAENYFALFHGVIGNVANLPPRVVEAIVRYYTYLKMSRDAAAALSSWEKVTNPQARQVHVAYVVHLLALSTLWGFVALWYMGQKATPADQELASGMEQAVGSVLGERAYVRLKELHPESKALAKFMGALLPVVEAVTRPSSHSPSKTGVDALAVGEGGSNLRQ